MSGKLTVKATKQLDIPGRYADGGGLYLHVRKGGSKQWLLRTTVRRKRTDIHIGSFTSWKNTKHAAQWINTLKKYAFPYIGKLKLDEISSAHIMKVLSPIWLEKPETARRLKQRLGTIMDWAKASGYRSGDSPLVGITDVLPKQKAKPKHHKAMPWKDIPAFMLELQKRDAPSALALQFLILTATRSGETRGAEWAEIDFEARTWTIPAERMKMDLSHRVPLSNQAIAILEQSRGFDDKLVFPSNTPAKPLSDMVFSALYKRMCVEGITTHGFRSSFRDWCSDCAKASQEVSEAALAHVRGNMTERAYARSDLFDRRKGLMKEWSNFIIPF